MSRRQLPSSSVTSRLSACALLLAALLAPSDAHACGGCFHVPNPTGTVSVVAAHRMAFLSSPSESVLWDQVQFTGNPADFVWVLPVMGNPAVEVGDNGFFESLEAESTITMVGPAPPPTFCPNPCAPWNDGFFFGAAGSTRAASSTDAGMSSVNVLHEGVVGPYETATIMSSDPAALVTWLGDHGYMIDPSIEPTIAYYVGLGMNFVALRLRPQAGVDRMAPVRIRSPGLSLTLPLRMIAAGVGASVDLELYVFAEARMGTANFPNAEVDRAAITYDWASRTFDYDARFEDALFRGTGLLTNWVTEYARAPSLAALGSFRSGTGMDVHSAMQDVAIVQAALPNAYMTRLRTRLTPSQLATDLTLSAASGGDIGTNITVTREVNRAPDPVCDLVCDTADGLEPGASSERGTGRSYRCSAAPAGRPTWLALLAIGLVTLALGRRRA